MSQTKTPPAVRRMLLDLAQHRRDPSKYQCAGCRDYFPQTSLQVDHIIPEADSTPEMRSDVSNLQLLCAPKGATMANSCHRRKTYLENRERARRNRPKRSFGPAILFGSLATLSCGYTWFTFTDPASADQWLLLAGLGVVAANGTYLVQKGFRRRRPRKKILTIEGTFPETPKVESPASGGLDMERIIESAREIMGGRGDISVDGDERAFTIAYSGTGFADHEDEKKFALLAKIQAKTGQRYRPVWNTQDDLVTFTRRPELARMLRHPGLADSDRPWHVLPIAPGVSFDLMVTPHVLIVGTTGAGKTALMRTMIVAVAESARREGNTRTILADPKLIEMPGFEGWEGISEIVSESHELWDMAQGLVDEMFDRLRLIKAKKAKTSDFRKIIVVIDEYEQFFKRMKDYWETEKDEDGKPLKKSGQKVPTAISNIQTVLSMARKVNIHIVIGTQSPDASWFGSSGTRENLSGRAAVGPVDQHRARMMFDDSSIGRDVPVEFKGRTTVQIGDGEPIEVQVYYTPDPFDPDDDNTAEDWTCLLNLGMPADHLPDEFKELVNA